MDDYGNYMTSTPLLGIDNYGDEFTVGIAPKNALPRPDITNVYNEAALQERAA